MLFPGGLTHHVAACRRTRRYNNPAPYQCGNQIQQCEKAWELGGKAQVKFPHRLCEHDGQKHLQWLGKQGFYY